MTEKKEIGKLIELLNEFENEEADTNIRYWNYYQNGFHLLEYGQTYSEMLIISKKYGFIKYLVDNDKIDRKKLDICLFSDGLVYSDSDCSVYRSDTIYDMVLMLLSISDTPIDDLISYLK